MRRVSAGTWVCDGGEIAKCRLVVGPYCRSNAFWHEVSPETGLGAVYCLSTIGQSPSTGWPGIAVHAPSSPQIPLQRSVRQRTRNNIMNIMLEFPRTHANDRDN